MKKFTIIVLFLMALIVKDSFAETRINVGGGSATAHLVLKVVVRPQDVVQRFVDCIDCDKRMYANMKALQTLCQAGRFQECLHKAGTAPLKGTWVQSDNVVALP